MGRTTGTLLHFDLPAHVTAGLMPLHAACVVLVLRGHDAAWRLAAWSLGGILAAGALGSAAGVLLVGLDGLGGGILLGLLAAWLAAAIDVAVVVVVGTGTLHPRRAIVILPTLAIVASMAAAGARHGGPAMFIDAPALAIGLGASGIFCWMLMMADE